jgi:hypothetical protein
MSANLIPRKFLKFVLVFSMSCIKFGGKMNPCFFPIDSTESDSKSGVCKIAPFSVRELAQVKKTAQNTYNVDDFQDAGKKAE